MKKFILPTLVSSFVLLSGCAVQKQWGAAGGSRADGTIKLAYTHGAFEHPQVSSQQGQEAAEKRCKTWGYDHAESFDFENKACQQWSGTGCMNYIVTKEYQCVKQDKN